MTDLLQTWGSFYANHAAIRTLVAFVHVGALIMGGGLAVAADRTMLTRVLDDDWARRSLLSTLAGTHRLVVGSLVLITASGLLLFASDFETFLYSRFFWIKMGLVLLLLMNGLVLWRAERRALSGDDAAWGTLRFTAMASITLWFLTTLGGVALPNIG
jgi:hypothetical protein